MVKVRLTVSSLESHLKKLLNNKEREKKNKNKKKLKNLKKLINNLKVLEKKNWKI